MCPNQPAGGGNGSKAHQILGREGLCISRTLLARSFGLGGQAIVHPGLPIGSLGVGVGVASAHNIQRVGTNESGAERELRKVVMCREPN